MAKYGLFCERLRREGFDVVADLIEKLQAERDALEQERDALEQERDKLLRERGALNEIARAGDICCFTCAHQSNQDVAAGCELAFESCEFCSRAECYCRDCIYGDKWEWRGLQE